MKFNRPDKMMLCIYSDDTKDGTEKNLRELLKGDNPDDKLLHLRAKRVLKKIADMTEEEFAELEYFDALHYYIKIK